jgi:hypothetical protein
MRARLSHREGIDGTEFDLTCDHGVVHSEQITAHFSQAEIKACFIYWARRMDPDETSSVVFQMRVTADLLGRLARATLGCACSLHDERTPGARGSASHRETRRWHD